MQVDSNAILNFFEVDPLEISFIKETDEFFQDKRELDDTIECVFNYYRKKGYPHYKIRSDEKFSHMQSLINFNYDSIFKNDQIIQTMHGLRLAWSYFPHAWDIKCGTSKISPMENFNNDKIFKGTIRKCLTWLKQYGHFHFNENRLRQSLKIYTGTQAVSNFRPTAAGVIYKNFGGDGVVWDMSSGFGGRLIGALASKTINTYIGTDPSTKTYDGLCRIRDDYSYLNKNVFLHKCGSEDFIPDKNSLDLCFTSPPYFDTEKYSDESTQSYIKYPTKAEWASEFLFNTFKNCHFGLKKNGFMLINIANTPKYKNLEEDTIFFGKEAGFTYIKEIDLLLSSISGAGFKREPIFIFKKDK